MNSCRPFGPHLSLLVTVTLTCRSGLLHGGASRLIAPEMASERKIHVYSSAHPASVNHEHMSVYVIARG